MTTTTAHVTTAAADTREAFRVSEVAEKLGVTPKVVRGMIHRRQLRARWTGAQWNIPKSALAEYLSGGDDPALASAS